MQMFRYMILKKKFKYNPYLLLHFKPRKVRFFETTEFWEQSTRQTKGNVVTDCGRTIFVVRKFIVIRPKGVRRFRLASGE